MFVIAQAKRLKELLKRKEAKAAEEAKNARRKLSKVLAKESEPFSIIILSFNVDFMN